MLRIGPSTRGSSDAIPAQNKQLKSTRRRQFGCRSFSEYSRYRNARSCGSPGESQISCTRWREKRIAWARCRWLRAARRRPRLCRHSLGGPREWSGSHDFRARRSFLADGLLYAPVVLVGVVDEGSHDQLLHRHRWRVREEDPTLRQLLVTEPPDHGKRLWPRPSDGAR